MYSDKSFKFLVEEYIKNFTLKYGADLDSQGDLYKQMVNQVEKSVIAHILKLVNNNQSKASRVLKINRGTLRSKIEELKISADE